MPVLVPQRRLGQRLLSNPGFGAIGGAILVGGFFAIYEPRFGSPSGIANWLDPASMLGIGAVTVALLLIGGEFDLSAGVTIGSTGLVMALTATRLHLNIWVAMALALVLAVGIGLFNGMLVVRTKLPSFIVTLGSFFLLQGLNQGVAIAVTGTVLVGGLSQVPGYQAAYSLLGSEVTLFGTRVYVAVFWWIAITALGALLLGKTRFGNWVLAVGGEKGAAARVGVPVNRTKVTLFVMNSLGAWLVGMITALRFGSIQTGEGVGKEMIYMVAAVVGGCVLTGGYGSIVGTAFGALIFGMAEMGIPYAGWNGDWFYAFLGAALIIAVLANQVVARRATRTRSRASDAKEGAHR